MGVPPKAYLLILLIFAAAFAWRVARRRWTEWRARHWPGPDRRTDQRSPKRP